jgi:hypothetical protein
MQIQILPRVIDADKGETLNTYADEMLTFDGDRVLKALDEIIANGGGPSTDMEVTRALAALFAATRKAVAR